MDTAAMIDKPVVRTRPVAYLEIWKGVARGTFQVYIFKSVPNL